MKTVLIIDDEEKLRSLLKRIISLEGIDVLEAASCKEARKKMNIPEVDVVLCDVKLPDGNGVDLVKEIRLTHPLTEIILLTAYGNVPDGVQAIRNGAFDYIMKGDDNDKIVPLLHRAIDKVHLAKKASYLQKQVGSKYSFSAIIGNSPAIQQSIVLAKKVADTDTTVLLLGKPERVRKFSHKPSILPVSGVVNHLSQSTVVLLVKSYWRVNCWVIRRGLLPALSKTSEDYLKKPAGALFF